MMRTVFMGTPDFGIGCLDVLIEKTNVVAVVSQPDKPRGRGHKLMPTPIKEHAEARGIKVYQPESLKNEAFLETLKMLDPDLIVVVAYGKLLPEYILNYPKFGCINVHASLLPKLRGAAPIQRCIINGDSVTGVTTMMMEKGLDTGDMLVKRETEIFPEETGGQLFERLAEMGADALFETLDRISEGTLERTPQNHNEHTYAPMLDRETGHIDFSKTAREIKNLVRGLNPVPMAYCKIEGKTFKIASVSEGNEKLSEGTVGEYHKAQGLPVGCKDGCIYIKELKPEGKALMSVHDYMRGNSIRSGSKAE